MPLPKGLVTGKTAKFPLHRELCDGKFCDYKVALPLPPKELSPNTRCHWGKKAKAIAEYRANAANYAASLVWRDEDANFQTAKEQTTFYFRDKRRRDADNLLAMLKSAFDGIVDGGILADDSGLTHLPIIVLVDKENPRVEIRIWREA